MRGGHRGHDGDGGPRDLGERGDLARPVRAELERGRAVLGGELDERERQPPLVVEARLGLEHGPERGQHRRHHLLGRGLAVRARHRRDRNREPLAVPGAQPPEGLRRLVHQHDRHARRQIVGHRVDHEAGGAAPDGVAQEGVAVEALAADGEEHLTDAQAPAVDGDAGHGDAEVASEEGAAGAADDVFDGECRHARSYVALPARAARAWIAVVEGEHLGTDDLVRLVALAGDDDDVAGAGPG